VVGQRIRANPLVAFFVIAFGFSWLFQIVGIVLALANDLRLSNEDNLFHLFDLVSAQLGLGESLALGAFLIAAGPLVAALVVTSVTTGRPGLRELWGRITKWRIAVSWYGTVLLIPLAIGLISLLAGVAVGGIELDSYEPLVPFPYLVPLFLYFVVFTALAEEPGWRGFALPHLQSRYTAERSSWILGIIWGVWHFPFTIYNTLTSDIPPGVLVPILVGLVLGIVGWTIVNTWIYNSTESVFLIVLLHAWYNTVNSYVILPFENMVAQTLNAVLPWALAVYLTKRYGAENLAARPRPVAKAAAPEPA
jgi:membrane protease YdiL (CAAX protease family)